MNVFLYRAGRTFLHGMDVRFKLLSLVLLVLATLNTVPSAVFGVIAVQLLVLKRTLRMPLHAGIYGLRYFLVFLLLIVVLRTLTPADSVPAVFDSPAAAWPGLREGVALASKMLAVVLFGIVLIATTRAAEIKAAMEWLLKRIPGVPAVRIATMLGLLLRFMPLIFQQAGQTLEAQRARGVENRRNPVYRMTRFALPFMRRTVESADRLALAMTARGYGERRTPPRLTAGRRDWFFLATATVFGLLLVMV